MISKFLKLKKGRSSPAGAVCSPRPTSRLRVKQDTYTGTGISRHTHGTFRTPKDLVKAVTSGDWGGLCNLMSGF